MISLKSHPFRAKIQQYLKAHLVSNQMSGELKEGVHSVQYMSDSCYIGQMINEEEKSGQGIYKYDNGDVYIGEWRNDVFHGHGSYIFANGQLFQGQFRKGQSYQGTYYYKNGNQYRGEFSNALKNGFGTLIYNDQLKSVYEGLWKDGQKHGNGKYFNRQMEYQGQWKNGKPYGKCTLKTKTLKYSGLIEEWHFVKGIISIQYSPESSYQGQIVNGLKQGEGVYKFNLKNMYKGSFKNDTMHGMGRLQNQLGFYEGQFRNGLIFGSGTFVYADGNRYTGEWFENMRHGKGQILYSNGDIYQGTFFRDKKQGKGLYRHRNKNGSINSSYEGEFQDDLRHGFGKYKDHTFSFQGDFRQNSIEGVGILNNRRVSMRNGDILQYL